MMSATAAYNFFSTLIEYATEDVCRNVQPSINKYLPATSSFFRGKLIEAYREDDGLFKNVESVAYYTFPGIAALSLLTARPISAATHLAFGAFTLGMIRFTEKVINKLVTEGTDDQTSYAEVFPPTVYETKTQSDSYF